MISRFRFNPWMTESCYCHRLRKKILNQVLSYCFFLIWVRGKVRLAVHPPIAGGSTARSCKKALLPGVVVPLWRAKGRSGEHVRFFSGKFFRIVHEIPGPLDPEWSSEVLGWNEDFFQDKQHPPNEGIHQRVDPPDPRFQFHLPRNFLDLPGICPKQRPGFLLD